MDGQHVAIVKACRVPLAVPGSRRVEHCYAMLGKGTRDVRHAVVELVLVDAERDVWNVLGTRHGPRSFSSTSVAAGSTWRVLGWRLADGSQPFGDYDAVDPDLASLDPLPGLEGEAEWMTSPACDPGLAT